MEDSVDDDFAAHTRNSLYQLQQDGQYTDVELTSHGLALAAHKPVLAAASPYFAAMFSSGMSEATTNQVSLECVSGATLRSLVRYMYTAHVDVSDRNVVELVKAADMFQLERLKLRCELFLGAAVAPANALSVFNLASTYRMHGLRQRALALLLTRFPEVVRGAEFLALSRGAVLRLLQLDDIAVPCEDVILHAALTWVSHAPDTRAADLTELMTCVRLGYCSSSYLSGLVQGEGPGGRALLQPCPPTAASADPAATDLDVDLRGRLVARLCDAVTGRAPDAAERPRRLYNRHVRALLLLGGKADGAFNAMANDVIWELVVAPTPPTSPPDDGASASASSSQWSQIKIQNYVEDSSLRSMLSWVGVSVCVSQNKLIFTGTDGLGFFETSKVGVLEVGGGCGRRWSVHTGPAVGRVHHASLVLHAAQLYVLAGLAKSRVDGELLYTRSVEVMDLSTLTWRSAAPLPAPGRRRPLTAPLGMSVLVMGGTADAGGGSDMVCDQTVLYNSVLDSWEPRAPMPVPMARGDALVHDKQVYVFGGDSDFLLYAPDTDTWSVLVKPAFSHTLGSAVLMGASIWVLGGIRSTATGEKRTAKVEEFALGERAWRAAPVRLPTGLADHQCVAVTYTAVTAEAAGTQQPADCEYDVPDVTFV